jgi:hypothetical protein
VLQWKVYRDGDGRMRQESPDGKTIMIFDAVTGETISLFPERKQAMKSTPAYTRTDSPSWHPVSPSVQPAYNRTVQPGTGSSEDLGTQVINGVTASGVRVRIKIPAGAIGTDRDSEAVTERWESTDLHGVVRSSNTDPRFGVTTYELTGVVRGAQDPHLFEIPAGYTVFDGGVTTRGSWIIQKKPEENR